MQRPILVGEYEFTLDAKNRVAVPARLRSVFGNGIYLTKENERCLGGYGPEEFAQRLAEDTEAAAAGSAKRRNVKRFIAANAVFMELDRQGRVTLPGKHLDYAGIGRDASISREVTIIGAQDHIEIWDRAAWADFMAHLEEEADADADERATP